MATVNKEYTHFVEFLLNITLISDPFQELWALVLELNIPFHKTEVSSSYLVGMHRPFATYSCNHIHRYMSNEGVSSEVVAATKTLALKYTRK